MFYEQKSNRDGRKNICIACVLKGHEPATTGLAANFPEGTDIT